MLYVGLMSGTSLDGIDGVLADLSGSAQRVVRAHVHRPFHPDLRATLLALNHGGSDELHRGALAANALALAYADVVANLLNDTGLEAGAITAVGAHGQTVRHQPGLHDGIGYTTQLLNGALLAERTGIDVVCDFRSRDVAAGGQGAPLVPAFHRALMARPGQDWAVVNIGGIANITLLHADGRTAGHDCGPGNVLMDLWCQAHTGDSYDAQGQWAATGQPITALLDQLMAEPYFRMPPPKSTGRDLFHRAWLDAHLGAGGHQTNRLRPADVQATLCHLTARLIADDLRHFLPAAKTLLVCGGGAHNTHLMRALAQELPTLHVGTTLQLAALDPMHVEATAFAWLANRFVLRHPANCTDVTGASGPRILGALYPA